MDNWEYWPMLPILKSKELKGRKIYFVSPVEDDALDFFYKHDDVDGLILMVGDLSQSGNGPWAVFCGR